MLCTPLLVELIKLYSSVIKLSAFWLANWVRSQTALLYITVLTFFLTQALYAPRARGIKLSRNHSPSHVFGLLIAMCSALRCILNYRYASGQFCYCRHAYCAIICYTPQELHVLQAESAEPCSIVTLPRNCTYCRLRAQHRVLLLHSPGTARTAG